jgi:hypothetical protein
MDVRYPLMPKDESRRVRCEIRRVFVDVWDPIGVMSDPGWPRDEYDNYIGRVFELLVLGSSDNEIIRHLEWVVECIGMDGSRVSLRQVVEELRRIPLPSRNIS